jgi:hypothetical protein
MLHLKPLFNIDFNVRVQLLAAVDIVIDNGREGLELWSRKD